MKRLKKILPKKSGRANGRVSVRHQGGRHKRFMRVIDFKRDKRDIWGKVEAIEYDPNRNANVAMLLYEDGGRRYVLAPEGLKVGAKVIAGEAAPLTVGNALPLKFIPIGTAVHNIEIRPGKGGQVARGAGSSAVVQGKEESYVLIKMPSTEIRRFVEDCYATIGQMGNMEHRSRVIGKAGTKRRMGIRPSVRGKAQHPGAHPHGGGEGRSPVGLKYPKTYVGKPAVGRTRKKRKYSDKMIVKRRKPGAHGGKA